jgi:hypothetical protein
MHMSHRAERLVNRRALALLVALAAAVAAWTPGTAKAETREYFNGPLIAYIYAQSNVTWYLTGSYAQQYSSTATACAGAKTSGGSFYGSKICASNYACHEYGGSNALYALAYNWEPISRNVIGRLYTNGSQTGGPPCPRGSYYSQYKAGTTETHSKAAARQRKLVPALRTSRSRPRFASGAPEGATAYGQPAQDQVCLTAPDPTGDGSGYTCQKTSRTADGNLWLLIAPQETVADDAATLIAAAPNGATSAVISDTDGEVEQVPLRDGLVVADVDGDVDRVTWQGGPRNASSVDVGQQ